MNDQQTREHHVPQKSGNIDNRRRGAATGMRILLSIKVQRQYEL